MVRTGAEQLRLGYFSVPVVSRVARTLGCYAAHGVQVTEAPVASSVDQFRRLVDGDLDVLVTSPDNVLAYRMNRSNPLGDTVDVRVLRAVDGGLGLSLLAAPGIGDIAGLRGRRIAVDVRASGFAFALFAMLDRAGLGDGDYELLEMGSTPRRGQALTAGECDATLLGAGHDVVAEQRGAVRLARVACALGRYPATVLAAGGRLLDAGGSAADRFLAAWDEAVEQTLAPSRHELVVGELAAALDVPAAVARQVYGAVVDADEGLVPDGSLSRRAWALVVDLRRRAGGFDLGVDAEELLGQPSWATATLAAGTGRHDGERG